MLADAPLVWVFQGPRAGDNAQARALGRLISERVLLIKLDHNWQSRIPNMLRPVSMSSLHERARRELVPPWPDFVIGVGRRMAPILLAVKAKSLGRTKAICIGRPRMPLNSFDLVITTPQYLLPPRPNVLELQFPLVDRVPAPDDVRERLAILWRDLPRPWIVAAVGAAKFPYRLGPVELRRFGTRLATLAEQTGGSVMLFSSPRSAPDSLAHIVPPGASRFWRSDQIANGGAYYSAALQLADRCVVTSDSVSMLADMCATGREVLVERLPVSPFWISWTNSNPVARWLSEKGVVQAPRNVPAYIDRLVERGIVSDLAGSNVGQRRPAEVDYETLKSRVLGLSAATASGS